MIEHTAFTTLAEANDYARTKFQGALRWRSILLLMDNINILNGWCSALIQEGVSPVVLKDIRAKSPDEFLQDLTDS